MHTWMLMIGYTAPRGVAFFTHDTDKWPSVEGLWSSSYHFVLYHLQYEKYWPNVSPMHYIATTWLFSGACCDCC